MRKKLFIIVFSISIFLSGCSVFSNSRTATMSDELWWGTKQEIKTFLDSPDAKSELWVIQSMSSIK